MTTTTKPKSVHAAQQYRDTMENAADSSREATETFRRRHEISRECYENLLLNSAQRNAGLQ